MIILIPTKQYYEVLVSFFILVDVTVTISLEMLLLKF